MTKLTGSGSLSLQKGKVVDSSEATLDYGYRKITFAHKMSPAGGEDHIPLDALNYPTGYEASLQPNPTADFMLKLNLREFCSNLSLYSTSRGLLIPDLSYWCSNSKIHFNGFTASPNEIFYGVIEHVTRPNTLFVDAKPINISRTLPLGQTTVNVGDPYEVNAYENESSGAIKVYVDGQLKFRNTNNSDTVLDRDYYEVPTVDGLGSTIEFNAAFGSDVEVTIVSNYAFVDRPNFSLLNRFDVLAAQLESIATQTGSTIDLSQFPNTFDIKAFGDRLLNAEASGVPSGGTLGQVLTKTASAYTWQDASGGGGMIYNGTVNTQISSGQTYTVPANNIYEGNVSGNGGTAIVSVSGQINGYFRVERTTNGTAGFVPISAGGGNSFSLLNAGSPARFTGYLLTNA